MSTNHICLYVGGSRDGERIITDTSKWKIDMPVLPPVTASAVQVAAVAGVTETYLRHELTINDTYKRYVYTVENMSTAQMFDALVREYNPRIAT